MFGLQCMKCTQQAINVQGFGEETLGAGTATQAVEIVSSTKVTDKVAKLKLTSGGLMFGVPKPTCRIGQDQTNDICILDDATTAKFHAQISYDENTSEYVIRDLGTKDGTFLNGSKVQLDETIFDGDLIKIGKYKFYFMSDVR